MAAHATYKKNKRIMNPHRILRSSLCLLLMAVGSQAMAQVTTYSYQSNAFDFFFPPYSAANRISGSLTLDAPLPPSTTTDLTATLTTFSFTDGVAIRDFSNTTICDFQITTNAQGRVANWSILLRQDDPGPTGFQHSLETYGAGPDQAGFSATPGTTGCGTLPFNEVGASNVPIGPAGWTGGPITATSVPSLSGLPLAVLTLLLALGGLVTLRKSV